MDYLSLLHMLFTISGLKKTVPAQIGMLVFTGKHRFLGVKAECFASVRTADLALALIIEHNPVVVYHVFYLQ